MSFKLEGRQLVQPLPLCPRPIVQHDGGRLSPVRNTVILQCFETVDVVGYVEIVACESSDLNKLT